MLSLPLIYRVWGAGAKPPPPNAPSTAILPRRCGWRGSKARLATPRKQHNNNGGPTWLNRYRRIICVLGLGVRATGTCGLPGVLMGPARKAPDGWAPMDLDAQHLFPAGCCPALTPALPGPQKDKRRKKR